MAATPSTSLGFQNFFSATLTSDITASSTDIPMDAIPNATEGFLVIEPDSTSNREVIFYDSKTSLKVVCPSEADGRGQDDTTAGAHSTGATVIMAPVAAFWEALQSGLSISDEAILNRHLKTGTDQPGGAWNTWAPTFTSITEGNGTTEAYYKLVGKTVHFHFVFTLGSTSSVGAGGTVSPPLTAASRYDNADMVGLARFVDATSVDFGGMCRLESTTALRPITLAGGGQESGVTSTSPFTWATGDQLIMTGSYEAA